MVTAHVQTHSQNFDFACPFMRHCDVSPPSWTKNIDSISSRVITPKELGMVAQVP
jgi:hypothetical protein